MENFGKKCHYSECRQLDFLPVQCRYCQNDFCQDHQRQDQHNCSGTQKNEQRVVSESKGKKRCPIEGCKTVLTLTNQYDCPDCGKKMCLGCRFPEKHQCISKPKPAAAALQSQKNGQHEGNQMKQKIKEPPKKKKKGFFFCCGSDKQHKPNKKNK